VRAASGEGDQSSTVNAVFAEFESGINAYAATDDASMASGAVGNSGGGQPVDLMNPYTCVNFIIALFGIYPSRS
jgi:microcystin-dependent protein